MRNAYAGLSPREVTARDFVSGRHTHGKYIAFATQCKVVRAVNLKIVGIGNFDLSGLIWIKGNLNPHPFRTKRVRHPNAIESISWGGVVRLAGDRR